MPSETQKLTEMILRLQASSAALIFVLRQTPAGDNKPILEYNRWEMFEAALKKELSLLSSAYGIRLD